MAVVLGLNALIRSRLECYLKITKLPGGNWWNERGGHGYFAFPIWPNPRCRCYLRVSSK